MMTLPVKSVTISFTMTAAFANLFILIIVVLIVVLVENLFPIGLATVTVKRK